MNAELLYMLKGCIWVAVACVPIAVIGAAIANYIDFKDTNK